MVTNPRDLLKGYVEISSLPTVHLRLDEAINNPKKSMVDIAKIIREDPGLSARLLRIVNSAFYNFPSRIETISQAVTVVGTQQIGALSLATVVMDLFEGIPQDLVDMKAFWKHSVGTGLAARILGVLRREANAERLFVAGMLHDIGRLVIYTKAADDAREALVRSKAQHQLLFASEQELFGFTHATVGGLLLRMWKLPPSLEEVVMYHHRPCDAARFPVDAAIVHIADILAHALELGNSGDRSVPPLDEKAWQSVGLPSTILPTAIEQMDRQYQDAIRNIL
jgi:HD-like signal output (HDOD) protein